MDKDISRNSNQKRAQVAITSDKIYFKADVINRDKEGCFIMTKVSIYQKNITVTNIYSPNKRTPKFMKGKHLQKSLFTFRIKLNF